MSEFDRSGGLTPGARLRWLQELLEERGSLSLRDAMAQLRVSEMTLRRDFVNLERLGLAERTWGGILARQALVPEVGHDEREQTEAGAKSAIATLVDSCIIEGDTVFLSGGTTALAVARCLARRSNITVITTSLHALVLLSTNPDLVVIALGGRTSPYNNDTSGPQALAALSGYRADKAVVGATGIREDGVFNANLERAAIDRMMVERANTALIAADHTKLGRSALSLVTSLGPTTTLVTDVPLARHACQWFHQASASVLSPGDFEMRRSSRSGDRELSPVSHRSSENPPTTKEQSS